MINWAIPLLPDRQRVEHSRHDKYPNKLTPAAINAEIMKRAEFYGGGPLAYAQAMETVADGLRRWTAKDV